MNYDPDKIAVSVDISHMVPKYVAKVIIFFNNSWLIDNYSAEHLEDNQIFAFGFDTTPVSKILQIRDYKEVLDAFPDNNRVLADKLYIGNVEEGVWEDAIHQFIKQSMMGNEYEVVVREDKYTIV